VERGALVAAPPAGDLADGAGRRHAGGFVTSAGGIGTIAPGVPGAGAPTAGRVVPIAGGTVAGGTVSVAGAVTIGGADDPRYASGARPEEPLQ
jgi:hypothetical protein